MMEMSPAQRDRVKELYAAALESDTDRRAALLQENAADEVVREEVRRLLAERDDVTGVLSDAVPDDDLPDFNKGYRRFVPGQVLADRFRIVDFIAAGGMGEVYQADDLELKESLALKTIRPEILQYENAVARFKREVHLARKVTHPNICRVFDLFWHKTARDSGGGGVVFVTMELLRGETLAKRIKRVGRFNEKTALQLIQQIASGLEAAHRAGVVHRDFKPGNVILLDEEGHEEHIRSVITDFGLAMRTGVDASVSVDLTAARDVIGTPAYMAPEQFEGRDVTKLADIYALGLVIHEMVTGVRPDQAYIPSTRGTNNLNGAQKAAKSSKSVKRLVPGCSDVWDEVIARCLQRDPNARFSSALDVATALSDHKPKLLPSHRSKWIAVGAASLILVMSIGLYIGLKLDRFRTFSRGRKPFTEQVISTAPSKSRLSVAVLGLKNASGRSDKKWFSTAIPAMLTTELAAGEQLRTVSGEEVAQVTTSLSLPEADGYGRETLQRIYKNLNADVIVVGSYVAFGNGQVRLDLRLQNASEGMTLASVSEIGTENQIDDVVRRAGAQLREKLGVGAVSMAEASQVQATLPATNKGRRLYAEGLAKMREFDNVEARNLLEKAVTEDPNFALAHSALAAAYEALGNDEKARLAARNAFQLSSVLSREDRLVVEARYREANQEWDNAAKTYNTLFGFFADNLDYGMLLADSEIRGGNAKEALRTAETLRRFPAPSRDDPRIDLRVAEAYLALGEFDKAQNSASAAIQKARANGSRLILADALFRQAQALENLNKTSEAITSIQEAAKIYNSAGNYSGEARSLEVMANVYADKSEFSKALANYKKELATALDIGNRHLEASAVNNMAVVLKLQGDPEGAKRMWEQALVGFRDLNDRGNSAEVLINLGGISLEEGNLIDAKKIYERALSTSQEINDQSAISMATAAIGTVLDAQANFGDAQKMLEHAIEIDLSSGLKNAPPDKLSSLADVFQHQGNLSLASKFYKDALAQSQESGDKANAAYALTGLGKIAFDADDFKEARKDYEEALSIQNELGAKRNINFTQLALADLATEEERWLNAVEPIRSTILQFRSLRGKDDELEAVSMLARTLISQSKFAEAARELNASSMLAATSQNPAAKIEFEVATARVEAASGKTADAAARLKKACANAIKLGLLKQQLESRLATEETAAGGGKSPESRARLVQLQQDASKKGFIRIARKAERLAKV
jgi:serine/threonine protein kinase/tetratricopeptide (TPR) repeat protein